MTSDASLRAAQRDSVGPAKKGIHVNESLHIVIAGSFAARMGRDVPATLIDPEKASTELGALSVAVRHRQAHTCVVTPDGALKLEFGEGLTIEVPSDPQYEAWQMGAPQAKIISMPGGELAVWEA